MKIGTEVAHITRDSDSTFNIQKVKLQGAGHIVAASRTACYTIIDVEPQSSANFTVNNMSLRT